MKTKLFSLGQMFVAYESQSWEKEAFFFYFVYGAYSGWKL